MVFKKNLVICLILIWLSAMTGLCHWGAPGPKSVATCKTTLSTQSIEQVSEFISISSSSTWEKNISVGRAFFEKCSRESECT